MSEIALSNMYYADEQSRDSASRDPFSRKAIQAPIHPRDAEYPNYLKTKRSVTVSSVSDGEPQVTGLAAIARDKNYIGIVDEDKIDVARSARSDAVHFLTRISLGGDPFVSFSSDGILSLQWRGSSAGVALLFAGDREVSIVMKRPGQRYTDRGIDITVDDEFPLIAAEVIASIIG